MSFAEHISEHRRITILRLLETAPGYSLNESIVADAVNGLGIVSSRDQIRSELAWLKEQGLVQVEDLQRLQIATLTTRGQDVAIGKATVPGVKRPSAKG